MLFFVHHTPSSLSLQALSDSSSLEDVASALFASASDVGSLVRDSGAELNLVQSSFDLTSTVVSWTSIISRTGLINILAI